MRRFVFCTLSALALGAALSAGCTQDFSVFQANGAGSTGTGGASSTTSSVTTGGGMTGSTTTTTGGGGCMSDAACDDKNPCTTDRCDAEGCSHTNQDGPAPDDGNACTTEVCKGGALKKGFAPKGTSCGNGLKCDGMGACGGCTIDQECMASGECKAAYCVNAACVVKPAPVGTPCIQGVCSMTGACVECIDGKQCGPLEACVNGACVDACANGKRDGYETDVDCGGGALSGCNACADGKVCMIDVDCLSDFCALGICSPSPTCMDNLRNGLETDVDCGGPDCPQCDVGKRCQIDADCQTHNCKNGQNVCE